MIKTFLAAMGPILFVYVLATLLFGTSPNTEHLVFPGFLAIYGGGWLLYKLYKATSVD